MYININQTVCVCIYVRTYIYIYTLKQCVYTVYVYACTAYYAICMLWYSLSLQYKPPSLKKKSAGTSKGPPPGSSVVMKQSNFAETYIVGSTDGVNGGVPTGIRSGSVRGNVVVAHALESKKTGLGETKVRKTTTHETSKQSSSAQSSSKTSARTMKTGPSSYDRVGDYDGMNIGYTKMGNDSDVDSLESYSRDSLVEKPKRKMVTRYICIFMW